MLVVVALASGSGDEPAATPLPPPPKAAARGGSVPAVGIRARVPRGWSASRTRRGVTMRSPDRSTAVAVVSPPRQVSSARVLRSALKELRRRYRVTQARPGDARRISRRPTLSAVISARSRRARLRILTAAVQGRRRAWLVEVFSTAGAPTARLVEAQVALNSVRLRG